MKKVILVLVSCFLSVSAFAQPSTVGVKLYKKSKLVRLDFEGAVAKSMLDAMIAGGMTKEGFWGHYHGKSMTCFDFVEDWGTKYFCNTKVTENTSFDPHEHMLDLDGVEPNVDAASGEYVAQPKAHAVVSFEGVNAETVYKFLKKYDGVKQGDGYKGRAISCRKIKTGTFSHKYACTFELDGAGEAAGQTIGRAGN